MYQYFIPHILETRTTSRNQYNETISSYEFNRTIEAAISIATHSEYSGNDIIIGQADYIGITNDTNVLKGDLIDSRFLVTFVNNTRMLTILYLKEIENDGRN